MPATYEPISTQTVSGTSTSTVTFSSIPQTYTDLILVSTLSQSADVSTLLRFNSDTATNYSSTRLRGTGAAASSERSSNGTGIEYWFGTLTGFGNVIWQIQNYSNATTYKSCLSRSNNTVDWMGASVGLWRSTAAISTVSYTVSSGYVIAGSTFTLYGIKAA
jgi:hypothetical protein